MTALLLAALLSASPATVPATLDRVAVALKHLERLQAAARRLDEAEAAILAARTSAERRAAWRAWSAARTELRTAGGAR